MAPVSFDKCFESNDFAPPSFRDFHRANVFSAGRGRSCSLRHPGQGTKFFAASFFPMAHNGIRCSRCMKDWVRLVGRANRGNEPTELFECPACGKQVEFGVEPQVPAVRRAGDMTQRPLAQQSPALGHAGRLEAI
jgi:hypothetical protein